MSEENVGKRAGLAVAGKDFKIVQPKDLVELAERIASAVDGPVAARMMVRLNIAWEGGESREYRVYHDGDGRPCRISQLVTNPMARRYWRTMWRGWSGGEVGRVELAKRVLESDQYRREMEERKAAQ